MKTPLVYNPNSLPFNKKASQRNTWEVMADTSIKQFVVFYFSVCLRKCLQFLLEISDNNLIYFLHVVNYWACII